MVHSGAFYDVEKKLLEPGEMPETLHWFKWQNFSTWSTGISLLVIVYYINGAAFLVDPSVARRSARASRSRCRSSSLFVGWLIYDALWRTLGETPSARSRPRCRSSLLFGAISAFTHVFSGRAAYIQTGVLIGTIMTGNVWFVHRAVAARADRRDRRRASEQDPKLSIRAKQRSIHNNYLTFPLLFIMLSQPLLRRATTHHLNWLILIA